MENENRKKYVVKWTEWHSCEVEAKDEEEAWDKADEYSGQHSTLSDAGNYEVTEKKE